MKIYLTNYYYATEMPIDKYMGIMIDRFHSKHHDLRNFTELNDLAPTAEDVQAYVIDRVMDRETYIKNFTNDLSKLDPYKTVAKIRELSEGKIPALICTCKMGGFCHRNLVKEWLQEHIPDLDITDYGDTELEDETLTKIPHFRGRFKFLSNFGKHKEIDYVINDPRLGVLVFRSNYAEKVYQVLKGLGECDVSKILEVSTPAEAKKLGKKITIRPDWDDVKIDLMRQLLENKFRIPELRSKLLATGDLPLIEGNTWRDTFWGVCDGIGENHLGRLLMELRSAL